MKKKPTSTSNSYKLIPLTQGKFAKGVEMEPNKSQETVKACTRCHKIKNISEFYSDERRNDGLKSSCKACDNLSMLNYSHTKLGIVTRIYLDQRSRSKRRNMALPTYSKQELKKWLYGQELFHELFDNWNASEFDRLLAPSVDRLDDYKPYTPDNIQLMTW